MIQIHGLNQSHFLKTHWEKKFLHLPNAYQISGDEILEDDILEMINDVYFETRLIQNNKLKEGPLGIQSLSELKDKWTLFLHNFNHYNQLAKNLEKSVEFIPKWLFDDVLLSASNKGSSMSAHIDNYNVFIVQIKGKRRWRIQEKPKKTFQAGKDLKILEEFKHDYEFILEPGDVLFIPPHVAHEAYSLEDSYSCSIGFKSLEEQDMLDSLLLYLMQQSETDDFYPMQINQDRESSAVIYSDEIDFITQKLLQKITNKEVLANWLMGYLAKPKKSSSSEEDKLDKTHFLRELEDKKIVFDEFSNIVSTPTQKGYKVMINEWVIETSKEKFQLLNDLLLNKELTHSIQKNSPIIDELYELYKQNILYFSED